MKSKKLIIIVGGLFTIFAGYVFFNSLTVPEHVHSRDDAAESGTNQSGKVLGNIKKLEIQVRNNPEDFVLIMDLGHAYLGAEQYVKSVDIFRKARRLKPNEPEVLTDLGISLRETSQPDEAIELFEKVIRIDPQYGEAWLQAAIIYRYNIKDNQKALEYFQKFSTIEPQSKAAQAVKEEISRIKAELQ